MSEATMNLNQGHWILANAGKKVLRPGGRKLTLELLDLLKISGADKVVEFAPGMGFTAGLVLEKHPKSYTAVELNEEAADKVRKSLAQYQPGVVIGSATEVPLADTCADCVYAEAMLTMQSEAQKKRIVAEAFRLLEPGGRYGIHELALQPDSMDETEVGKIQRDLATAIRVNARPLTRSAWVALLEGAGFKVQTVSTRPMSLLRPARLIEDEGFFPALKIVFNLLRNRYSRTRVGEMKKVFQKYKDQMNAVAIVAVKP